MNKAGFDVQSQGNVFVRFESADIFKRPTAVPAARVPSRGHDADLGCGILGALPIVRFVCLTCTFVQKGRLGRAMHDLPFPSGQIKTHRI